MPEEGLKGDLLFTTHQKLPEPQNSVQSNDNGDITHERNTCNYYRIYFLQM